jgi:hypothetical protein
MNVWEVKEICTKILDEVGQYFVGNRFLLRKMLAASLANGHVLFEDYPGLGKTFLAKTFAKVTGCVWRRIQFTPDLMAADILGTRVWRLAESKFVLERGPIFTNVLLADEINRSPPKTQSALLEAMEERQVTIEGETHKLHAPFFVIATQNPIELEGTYPPEDVDGLRPDEGGGEPHPEAEDRLEEGRPHRSSPAGDRPEPVRRDAAVHREGHLRRRPDRRLHQRNRPPDEEEPYDRGRC